MRRIAPIAGFALVIFITLTGCTYVFGPVKMAQAFTDAKSETIDQMGKAVGKNPSMAGVADARKAFEAKKADLVARRDELKAAPKGMNYDWQVEFSAMEARHREQLDGYSIKLSVDCKESCEEVKGEWKTLRKEFDDAVARY